MIEMTGLMCYTGFVFVTLSILFDTNYTTKMKLKSIIKEGMVFLGLWLCAIGVYYLR